MKCLESTVLSSKNGVASKDLSTEKSSEIEVEFFIALVRDEHLEARAGTQPHIMVSWANLAKKEYSIIIDDFEDTNSDIHSYRFLL